MTDYSIEPDRFARTMDDFLSKLNTDLGDACEKAVKKSLSKGSREEKRLAPVRTGGYKSGISYTTKKKKDGTFGEIGNKNKPGLAHLLEKGHARVGGGRVAPKVHIAPAADKAFETLDKELSKEVDIALK